MARTRRNEKAGHRWPVDIGFASEFCSAASYRPRRTRDTPRRVITPLNIHKFITNRVERAYFSPFSLPLPLSLYPAFPLSYTLQRISWLTVECRRNLWGFHPV